MLHGKAEPVSNRDELPEEKGASLQLRNLIRQRHAEWSDKTFGNVGPVGPLKHLSKEAQEAAVEPDDLSEWADMQFLLWDAQRRAGISDGEITAAMEEKLQVNMARQWPEPKDGEPRLHIKEAGNSPVIPDGSTAGMFNSARALLDALYEFGPDEIAISEHVTNLEDALQNAAAPQSLGSEPATVPGKWIPVSERMPENDVSVLTFDGMYKRVHHAMYGHWQCWEPEKITHWMPLPAAPQEVKSES
ncbi:TPA: DUF550 domain-containing protein [Citrobacter farmeri]|nr:DUF550 domain-containing protein [Citrobacter farmeri]HCB1663625.1 DUF550 domain-containing protein [Citrobacter farmeri]HCB1670814.1 DUF550 domain-containing protein [Citrobacter farmeri]HCB1775429.1 DUF550 domain-containing protein [Citrobacter farmeri]HCB1778964.1 DUF550 domain-containing protein [Citrobacter farmeri]